MKMQVFLFLVLNFINLMFGDFSSVNKKPLNFVFNHINSSNKTFTDKSLEEGLKIFNDFNSYIKFFK